MNNNKNTFYANKIIKLISPLTCQTFKVELNGEENELRELLWTILEINPKSIKGLLESYNNYYTLSSAVKNPYINTDPYNYYTVVIKGFNQANNTQNKFIQKELNKENFMEYINGNIISNSKANIDIINLYIISGDSNIINTHYVSVEDILGFELEIKNEGINACKTLYFMQYLH